MLGETAFNPYAINTFSGNGRQFDKCGSLHYVRPHQVSSYVRKDGTFVKGYYRDGDGNTRIDRLFGYFAHNPGTAHPISGRGGK